jgi:hypothetical protein
VNILMDLLSHILELRSSSAQINVSNLSQCMFLIHEATGTIFGSEFGYSDRSFVIF